ncbi:MAG: histidinol phosphatase [Verrucomicrobia bacterium]|nr:histidinol phosphatase [Verrucomicrobiota bacterium]
MIKLRLTGIASVTAIAFVALNVFSLSAHAAETNSPSSSKHSSIERMTLPRLKTTHEEVLRFQSARKSPPPLPGLHDYRAILHAHAEDSTHTGGTRPEMLADAKKAGVNAILLTDHYRPPRDFIKESWHGFHEGVLFIPGSEIRGFLIYPMESAMDKMEQSTPEFVKSIAAGDGLIFLSHVEERRGHSMEDLTGQEIYNRHYDAKKDMASLIALVTKMTEPKSLAELEEGLRLYPDEMLAFQNDYPQVYIDKWDAETQKRRLTGVAANDCHHNQVFIVKMVDEKTVLIGTIVDTDEQMRKVSASARPGILEMTKNRKPGDVLARLDFDPYYRSFRNATTHILAPELTEAAIRAALKAGHAYVSHDWMCDANGFSFEAVQKDASSQSSRVLMGDEVKFAEGMKLIARFPLACKTRLFKDGKVISAKQQSVLEQTVDGAGVYRVEGWLTVDGEDRVWIYSNPIYVR